MKNNSLNQEQATPAVSQTQPTAGALRAGQYYAQPSHGSGAGHTKYETVILRKGGGVSLTILTEGSDQKKHDAEVAAYVAMLNRETDAAELAEALEEAYKFTCGFSGRRSDKLNKNIRAVLARHANAGKGGVA